MLNWYKKGDYIGKIGDIPVVRIMSLHPGTTKAKHVGFKIVSVLPVGPHTQRSFKSEDLESAKDIAESFFSNWLNKAGLQKKAKF